MATLLEDLSVTAKPLSKRLGRSRPDIAHTVRRLDLPDEAIELIDLKRLTKGHGKALLTERDHHRRRALARRDADRGRSVRTLEGEVARSARLPEPRHVPHPDHSAGAERLQRAVASATNCDVCARPLRDGYQLVLDHACAQRLVQVLGVHDAEI